MKRSFSLILFWMNQSDTISTAVAVSILRALLLVENIELQMKLLHSMSLESPAGLRNIELYLGYLTKIPKEQYVDLHSKDEEGHNTTLFRLEKSGWYPLFVFLVQDLSVLC